MKVLLAAFIVFTACSENDPVEPPPAAAFPADYASSYAEVRDCRRSGDHDLSYIRVLADPAATAPYENRNRQFPDGAVVLKEEYEFGDDTCAGAILQWTVMVKASGSPEQLGWTWQRVGADRSVLDQNSARCQNCHSNCDGGSGGGYDYTCAQPP